MTSPNKRARAAAKRAREAAKRRRKEQKEEKKKNAPKGESGVIVIEPSDIFDDEPEPAKPAE